MKAIRLLGKQPLNMGPEEYERHRQCRQDDPHPKLDAHFDRMFDRQLDDRLAKKESATTAMLLGIADRAIGRLEALAAGHRQRAEAHAAQQSAILSFDASTEGERLRRYQFACSRSLFRSLDTLMKVRRSGLGAGSGGDGFTAEIAATAEPQTESSEKEEGFTAEIAETVESQTEPCPEFEVPCSVSLPVDDVNPQTEPTAPPVDHQNRQNEARAPQAEVIGRRRLPFHRTVLLATTLVILFGAAVRSHRNPRNQATPMTVDQRNPQNEANSEWRPATTFFMTSLRNGGSGDSENLLKSSPGSEILKTTAFNLLPSHRLTSDPVRVENRKNEPSDNLGKIHRQSVARYNHEQSNPAGIWAKYNEFAHLARAPRESEWHRGLSNDANEHNCLWVVIGEVRADVGEDPPSPRSAKLRDPSSRSVREGK